MRSLSQISAPLLPTRTDSPRSYARRRRERVTSGLTVLALFKHAETAGQIQVSSDGDAIGAVWINRAPLWIDMRDFGRFIVVTMPHALVREKNLQIYRLFDCEKFLPEERVQLQNAIEAAKRSRQRLMHGGRTAGLHPNATA